MRQGIAGLLTDEGVEVVARLPDAAGLLATIETHNPGVVLVDVRIPPTHTTEGLQAALELETQFTDFGVLVLLAGGRSGVGHMSKNTSPFVGARRRLGSTAVGGTVSTQR